MRFYFSVFYFLEKKCVVYQNADKYHQRFRFMPSLHGVHTALITPFTHDGALDEEGFRALIRRQVESGVEGIVPLGSTGEAPTLTKEEQKRIIAIAREETPEHTSLMVGTGTYSTAQTIENMQAAQGMGADSSLIITPYYNKPTQEGLYQHFKAIAKAVNLPIVIYNNQHRTSLNLQTDTLKRLMDIPSIIGVKEASGSISQISDVIELARKLRPEFSIVSGDDALTFPLMALGGQGVISVASNLIPEKVKALVDAASSGDFGLAREIHFNLMPLFKAIFIETNPIPIKAAMQLCGLPSGNCRLPLCSLNPENMLTLERVIKNYVEIPLFT